MHSNESLLCLEDVEKLPKHILISLVRSREKSNVEFILKQNLWDINYQDETGNTALHYAAKFDSIEILNLLLEHNAKVDILNNQEMNALQVAVFKGNVQIYNKLKEFTKDQDIKCKSNNTLLHLAVKGQNLKLVEEHINDSNLYSSNIKDELPLHCAVKRQSSQIVELLVEKMANLNDPRNSTIFEEAAMMMLKKRQINHWFSLKPHLNLEERATAFFWTAIESDSGVVFNHVCKETLTFCKDTLQDWEVYKEAIQLPNWFICSGLIDAGFDIHATDERKNTPLHYAAHSKRSNIFLLLIENGANPNAFNSASMAPICTALSYFNRNAIEQNLSLYCAIKKHIDSHKCSNGCFNILRKYLKKCKFIH